MHEIGVVKQVVRTVEELVAENNVSKIDEIVLDIGELSLIIPKYVEDIYPVATEGTILEGTKLIMNVIPGMAECDDCDEIFNVIEHEGYCPNCGSFEKSILTGQDFIKSTRQILLRRLHGKKFMSRKNNQSIKNSRLLAVSFCSVSVNYTIRSNSLEE